MKYAFNLLADVAPLPEVPEQSSTGMIIGGIALAVGVVLLGVWLVKRKSSGK